MFRDAKKVLVLIGCMFAAILLAACGSGGQDNNVPTQAVSGIAPQAAVNPNPGALAAPTVKPVAPAAATALPTTTGMGGVAATVALAAMAVPPPPSEPVDPCRALPCSDDSDPWLGCRYAAALYRDAPGTVQGVRRVVSKMTTVQLEWYKEALLESYARDLWYSADYRLGDPEDLEQSHRDVKAMVFGNNKDVEAMGEDVICGLLGSTEITLADVLAASRANSPFVAKKKAPKEESLYLRDPFTPDAPPPAALPAETGCGADPCPPQNAAPVLPDPAAQPVPAEPPADAPAPVPAEPHATDPAAPSEPGGAAPPANPGEGTVAYNSGYGF